MLKNMKNEKCTLQDVNFCEKTKPWKMRFSHSSTWNMKKIMKNMENEKYRLKDLKYVEKLKNVENEKRTVQDLEYGEKTEKKLKMRYKHSMT